MSTPDVSVVCSVYNGQRYLETALDSLSAQEGVAFECIVVNDGSTDESPDILDRRAAEDPRIRVIHQENTGLTRALIRGCAEARAPYIARQDADDLSRPGRLAALHALLDGDEKLGFVSSWTELIGPEDEFLDLYRHPADQEAASEGLKHNRKGLYHGSAMFRKSAYEQAGGYRPAFYFGQDADLWLRMIQFSQVAYAQDALYAYRVLPDSISTGTARHLQQEFGRLGQACHRARLAGESEEALLEQARVLTAQCREGQSTGQRNKRIAQGNYYIASLLSRRGDPAARRYYREALRLNPLMWRAGLKWASSWLGAGQS